MPDASSTKTGYGFKGWLADDNLTWPRGFITEDTILDKAYGDVTLKAEWAPITYSVTFNSNYSGGTLSTVQNFVYDTSGNLTPNSFTREGYHFIG